LSLLLTGWNGFVGTHFRRAVNSVPLATVDGAFIVIGCVTGNLGLGVNVRNVLTILRDPGFAVAALALDPGAGRGEHDLRHADITVSARSELPYPINLLVMAPATLQICSDPGAATYKGCDA
jgi:hypothetical protein